MLCLIEIPAFFLKGYGGGVVLREWKGIRDGASGRTGNMGNCSYGVIYEIRINQKEKILKIIRKRKLFHKYLNCL